MTVSGMREHVSRAYDADKWRKRVQDMPDRQVIAIYRTMIKRGQLPPKKKKDTLKCKQLSIFDLLEFDLTK